MRIPYYHVDAFTGNLFSGNPAGVCILNEWVPDEVLQGIATENSLSETAFALARDDHYELRWFTPKLEIDLCGHATLAAACVIFRCLGYVGPSVQFRSKSGPLTVERDGERLILGFPSRPPMPCPTPELLIRALGRVPAEIRRSRDYFAIFICQKDILEMEPDMSLLGQLDCLGIIVTAPGDKADFVSRFFAPRAGIPEDPVTGSAHCSLIPYWAERLGKKKMTALQLSARGGELFCEDRGDRVGIGGKAVIYMKGEIEL